MLTIYKASAGSGKTFRLVIEYLKLLLINENNYKRILAVTFTNKATAEMKERIINQLYEISSGAADNAYAQILIKELGLTQNILKKRAKEALRNILHDFNRFSINTIDRFTQKVIKAFNREIGITPGYILELDNDMLLQEATDRLITNVSKNKDLLKWLTELGEERIRDEKSFNIRSEIMNLGKELFKEKFQDYFSSEDQILYERNYLKDYQKTIQGLIRSFELTIKEKGEKGLKILATNNLTVTDFKHGKTGVASVFKKVIDRNYSFGVRITGSVDDPDDWVLKKHDKRDLIISVVNSQLLPLLNEILNYFEENCTDYYSAQKINDNLYTLGVLTDLQSEINELRHEKGILPISDSNLLLKKIIAGSDSPFIYEKIGNTFNYFMLDEFQDTSGMQWENFKPLISNSLAEGKDNLVVGDVKQSIYRWRNSNWRILESEIEKEFSNQQLKQISLNKNWRSDPNIIGFNNSLFKKLVEQISQNFNIEKGATGVEQTEASDLFSRIYSDIEQNSGEENSQKGHIKVNFLEYSDTSDFKESTLAKLYDQVKELFDHGYSGRDIAILVRRNSEGSDIIKHFLKESDLPENQEYNFEIISNESLFLNTSNSVSFVVQVITHLINPDDNITKANILNEYNVYLQPALNLSGKDIVYKTSDKSGQVAFNFVSQASGKNDYQLNNLYEDEFNSYFGPIINTLKTNILNASIDEAIMYICNTFNLFEIEEDLPFLQGLIDQAAQIKTNMSNDLSNFLKWWEEKGQKISVNVNDETNAIRLLTIHKAKGLEFKAVLIPFFDWKISWNYTPLIWCEPQSSPFNKLPLVPVKATKNMTQTIFKDEYFEEMFNTYTDNLNMVYVAFTRAVSTLIVNAPYNEKENSNPKKVNNFLYNSLSELADSKELKGEFNKNDNRYSFGKLSVNQKDHNSGKEEMVISKYIFNEFNSRLKLRTDSDDFFANSGLSNKNLGKLLHEILSGIKTKNDIQNACRNAFKQQKISSDEFEILQKWLTELIDSPIATDWFSGNYQVLNERNILSKTKIIRPDRILINNDRAIVIDYKLGEIEQEKYNRQVINYSTELKKTGFQKVDGFLWYLKSNKIEKVCSL